MNKQERREERNETEGQEETGNSDQIKIPVTTREWTETLKLFQRFNGEYTMDLGVRCHLYSTIPHFYKFISTSTTT